MRPQRYAVVGAFCGSVLLGWIAPERSSPGSSGTENTRLKDNQATAVSVRLEHKDVSLATAIRGNDVAFDREGLGAGLPDARLAAAPPAPITSANTPDRVQNAGEEISEVARSWSGGVAFSDPALTGTPHVQLASLSPASLTIFRMVG